MAVVGGGVVVREAVSADHSLCADIFSRAWNSALPNKPRRIGVFEFRELTRGERVLVAVGKRGVAGFISVWEPEWFVHHLFVDPAFQNQGVGVRLLRHVSALAKGRALTLKCQVENRHAMRFYERNGFRRTASQGADEFGRWVELRGAPPELEALPVPGERGV